MTTYEEMLKSLHDRNQAANQQVAKKPVRKNPRRK
jgi:hypothetical protein